MSGASANGRSARVAQGLISIHFVTASGSVMVAPFGGLERRLSTAPFCVGIPREGAPPIVLDFATSLVAEGKVAVASRGGKKLPPGALIGPDGQLSDDPALLYGPLTAEGPRDHSRGAGAIRAFGEHKGSGLALLCELLGGSLTGTKATSFERGRFANGMFSIYVDAARIDPAHIFDADMTRYIDWYRQGQAHPRREHPHSRRARARRPGRASGDWRAPVRRGLGVDCRLGEKGRGEQGRSSGIAAPLEERDIAPFGACRTCPTEPRAGGGSRITPAPPSSLRPSRSAA